MFVLDGQTILALLVFAVVRLISIKHFTSLKLAVICSMIFAACDRKILDVERLSLFMICFTCIWLCKTIFFSFYMVLIDGGMICKSYTAVGCWQSLVDNDHDYD